MAGICTPVGFFSFLRLEPPLPDCSVFRSYYGDIPAPLRLQLARCQRHEDWSRLNGDIRDMDGPFPHGSHRTYTFRAVVPQLAVRHIGRRSGCFCLCKRQASPSRGKSHYRCSAESVGTMGIRSICTISGAGGTSLILPFLENANGYL